MGFTQEQVANILKDEIEKPCEESHKAGLAVLRKELAALEAFTRDYPKHDQRLLIGTQFENWQSEPTEADIDPAALMKLCRGREITAEA